MQTLTDTAPMVNGVGVTVMGDMKENEEITVVFHNVVISELTAPDPMTIPEGATNQGKPRTDIRDNIDRYISVMDSAVSPNGGGYQTDSYKPDIRITTIPTLLSIVTVTPDPVDAESVETMTVTYTARDTVYGNIIEIILPTIGMGAGVSGISPFFWFYCSNRRSYHRCCYNLICGCG